MAKPKKARFRISVRTTRAQRASLDVIRRTFAEDSYLVFPVAQWYRRSAYDFLVVLRRMPQMMLLIRPAQKGIIEFRPNDGRDSFHKQWLELTAKKKSLSLIHWKKPLPRMEGKHDWVKFIPTSCIKEIELFTLGYMNP